jgi:hypothetical protein
VDHWLPQPVQEGKHGFNHTQASHLSNHLYRLCSAIVHFLYPSSKTSKPGSDDIRSMDRCAGRHLLRCNGVHDATEAGSRHKSEFRAGIGDHTAPSADERKPYQTRQCHSRLWEFLLQVFGGPAWLVDTLFGMGLVLLLIWKPGSCPALK